MVYIATHGRPEDIGSLSREKLLALVAEQQRQVTKLQGQLGRATATIQALQVEVERLTSGTFSFRQAPRPEEITEPPVEVPVTLETCPGCRPHPPLPDTRFGDPDWAEADPGAITQNALRWARGKVGTACQQFSYWLNHIVLARTRPSKRVLQLSLGSTA
jgi:hypothetical protein